jgi:hypothetical protein
MRKRLLSILASIVALSCTAEPLPKTVTFAEHIAPIIFDNCVECHRPGEAAPFSLTTFHSTRKRARTIRRVTDDGYMPPWHPVEGHGEFKDSRRLSDRQLQLLDRWVETGMKEGDPSQTPAVPTFPAGWRLGTPDLVVKMPKAFAVPADGPDIYRNFVVPLDLPGDKWVIGVEVRPSARPVVHHCLFFLDDSGSARQADGKDGQPGFKRMGFKRSGSLGGWAVGATPRLLPDGMAMPLKSGTDLILSTHFHPSGKAEEEQTTVALFFADKPPERVPMGLQIPPAYGRGANLDVPPGNADFRISDSFTVPVDMEIVTIGAHAHYIGKEMRCWAELPDGSTQKLFYIDDWDFNWQGNYEYITPYRLPRGTVVKSEIIFDNSADNPNNPFDPPRRISWGLESTDEMGSVIMQVVPVNPRHAGLLKLGIGSAVANGLRKGKPVRGMLAKLKQLDKNGNGQIDANEIPKRQKQRILRLDSNKNGVIESSEMNLRALLTKPL